MAAPTRRYDEDDRAKLVTVLQSAYSGERAAGHAYNGHWRSVRDADEREQIRVIELEEWRHREMVGNILTEIGAGPKRWREIVFLAIGCVLEVASHVSGWMLPMYGAGKLESGNIREYEVAARLAWRVGFEKWVDCLLEMAEVEWEHEAYFRSRLTAHRFWRHLPLWPPPPGKETIRDSFAAETAVLQDESFAPIDAEDRGMQPAS